LPKKQRLGLWLPGYQIWRWGILYAHRWKIAWATATASAAQMWANVKVSQVHVLKYTNDDCDDDDDDDVVVVVVDDYDDHDDDHDDAGGGGGGDDIQ